MTDWDTLRVVLSVHRMGGLSGAARDLRVSQPTVSRHLAKAEADLQCRLFDRRQGRLATTEAGLIVVREAERVERQVLRMQDSLRSIDEEMSGPISLSVPQQLLPYCLADEILAFSDLYPDITFNVQVSDALAEVDIGAVDIVFRVEENPKPSLWGKRIAPLGFGHYAHQSFIDRYTPAGGTLKDAESLPLIVHQGVTGSTQSKSETAFPNGHVIARTNSLEAHLSLIAAGMGIGRMPHLMARGRPDLREIAGPSEKSARAVWVLTHKDLRSIRRIESFVEFIDEKMRERRWIFEASDENGLPE